MGPDNPKCTRGSGQEALLDWRSVREFASVSDGKAEGGIPLKCTLCKNWRRRGPCSLRENRTALACFISCGSAMPGDG
jgi:hypothetical protein